MTKVDFAKCMAFLAASIDRPISRETIEAWYAILGEMEKPDFERAIIEVIRSHKFSGLPPVSMFLQASGARVGIVDNDAQAVLAWDTVLRAMRTHGGYVSVDWGDPAIPAAIVAVASSWASMCEIPSDELIRFVKPKFCEAWKVFRAAGSTGGTVSTGIIARDAARIGGDAPKPVRIGESSPAMIGFGAANGTKSLPNKQTAAMSLAGAFSVPEDEGE